MKHTIRILFVVVMVAAAGAVVSARVPARAVSGLEAGYWWQGQPNGAPLPPPPNVPANGLWISGNETSPVAVSAVRFQVASSEASPVLTAKVHSQNPPRDVSAQTNVGQVVVLACPATKPWSPASAGAWSQAPTRDCARAVHGSQSTDGSTISFDLGPLVSDGKVDVVFQPGTGAAVIPALPAVPGAPAPPQPSGFDLTFEQVTLDQVKVSPAESFSSETPAASTDAPVAAPVSDIGTTADVGAGGGGATDFNFAANAVLPGAGVGASSQPSVAPGSLTPQVRETAASGPTENKGYRALAVILLAALLFWAWRQAVPPRASRRTIYDGPPATA